MSQISFKILALIFFLSYYLIAYFTFIRHSSNMSYPFLKERWGTTLFRVQNNKLASQGEMHTYCYYPSGSTIFPHRSGEYILKKASSFYDCTGWYGQMEILEDSIKSENEKLSWPRD